MGKYRRIPTISGGEPKPDVTSEAELAADGSDLVLDLHGKTVAEALVDLDLFLDRAVVAGFLAVKVIHGKGTGALAKAVSAVLADDKRVKECRPSTHHLGGGVIVVMR